MAARRAVAAMKPAKFDYVRAECLEEVLDILAREGPEARVLAGGQSLLPMLNMRLARPRTVVDLMRIDALRVLRDEAGGLRIGAAVRQAELARHPGLARAQTLLALALPWVGHAQTRSRGTVCGSIAHADPSAELPLVLLAGGGAVHLRSRRRARRVPAELFFTGMMATARRDDELIEAVSLPAAAPGSGCAFREIARRHGDFAIVACAAVVGAGGARLAVGGVADRPVVRVLPLPGDAGLDAALDDFAWELEARDDIHATASYRRELVRRIGRAVIEEAAQCLG
jgi:2-furoyl-CoA dehydrogenase FAD binding subunit